MTVKSRGLVVPTFLLVLVTSAPTFADGRKSDRVLVTVSKEATYIPEPRGSEGILTRRFEELLFRRSVAGGW